MEQPKFLLYLRNEPFDPKEYKREIVVFNLYNGRILLIFPGGAKLNDTPGLLKGDYKDGRRITISGDMKDVQSKEEALQKVIKDWIKLVDKE